MSPKRGGDSMVAHEGPRIPPLADNLCAVLISALARLALKAIEHYWR